MPRCINNLAVAVAMCLSLAFPGRAGAGDAAGPSREYQVKAAFLFHFAQFVEWPADAFENAESPLVIGVVGTDPFAGAIEAAVKDKQVAGRSIRVEHYADAAALGTCHILFIAASEAERMPKILDGLAGKPTLTVAEFENFTRAGGSVRFYAEENKVRFEIRVKSTQAARLKVSAKLLKLARIYQEQP